MRTPGFDDADYTFDLVPRPELNKLLADAVGAENIVLNAKVLAYEERADRVIATLSNGQIEEADMLPGADGVYSAVRAHAVDAAHGLSPHISAGGTLGVEDIRVLIQALQKHDTFATALSAYESNRIPHYKKVHELAYAVEMARDAEEYAREYSKFSHWMLNEGYRTSREQSCKFD